MIKRFIMALAFGLLVSVMANAEIQIKDLDGTNVEITFTFQDDTASEMGVIGSFNNWTQPGEMMAKNASQLWEKTIKASVSDVITYKFLTKGTWIFDEKAPDFKDDGYGGKNGLINVADILAGVIPAVPTAAPVAGTAGAVAPVYNSKLTFGMTTILGSRTTFSTQGLVDKTQKGLEADASGFSAKSNWTIRGTIVPGLNMSLDVAAFDGYKDVWAQDSRGNVSPQLDKGLANLFGGLATNPAAFMTGANPTMKAFKMGIDTPILVWETGYGEAKAAKRDLVLWQTVYDRSANDGYMRFEIGSELKKVGGGTLEAGIAPNRLRDEMGVFTWVGYSLGSTKVDFQYDAKSAQKTELRKAFDKLYHQDFILGAKTKVGDFEFKGEGLLNQFSEVAFEVARNTAAEAQVAWDVPNFSITGGYRYTGEFAEMLFGNNNDSTGNKGTQRVLLNVNGKPVNGLKLGIDSNAVVQTKTLADGAVEFYAKAFGELSLDALMGKNSSLNTYTKLKYNWLKNYQYDPSQSAFLVGEAGAKWYLADPLPGAVTGMDLYYGWNNWDTSKVFNTLVASLKLPQSATLEVGTGLRLVRDSASSSKKNGNNLGAFSFGGSWRVPLPAIKSPLLFGAFAFNMDPYSDNSLSMSDYTTDGGTDKSDGKAQLRVLLKWEL